MFTKFQTYFIAFFVLFILSGTVLSQNTPEQDKIISVERIWDRAGHNAFTDLIYFNDMFYCVFRESATHKPDQNEKCIINGSIRIIASKDGHNWASVAHIFEKDADLRDPKLSVTPDNRLMLLVGTSIYKGTDLKSTQGKVSFFNPVSKNFTQLLNIYIDKKIRTERDWLWNVTWYDGTVYGVVYQGAKNELNSWTTHLVKSKDGIQYEYVSSMEISTNPNEADVKFLSDGKMIVIVRGSPGAIGVSSAPYKNWNWNLLPVKLGGPEFVVLENNSLVCATREDNPGNAHRTILAQVSLTGNYKKILTLPSGGDTSYAGLVVKDGILYISYYSSHEGQTSIYTATSEKGVGKSSIYLAKVWADRLK
jgi:hypothetical protein